MSEGLATRVIAACLGLGAFAVALLAAMAVDASLDDALSHGLVSLGACYVVGLVIGSLGERIVREQAAAESMAEERGQGGGAVGVGVQAGGGGEAGGAGGAGDGR